MASEIRVNKIENRSGLGTVTFADTGVDLAGIVTATTFSGSGASLTNLPAANVTGTLPAISAANLTNVPAANITGTLPAISAANLTNVPAANITGTLPAITAANLTNIPAANIVGVATAGFGNASGAYTQGITMIDQYRVHTSFQGTVDPVQNLERTDDATDGFLGTGMTESSGIFTFPQTGIYLVEFQINWFFAGDEREVIAMIYVSSDSGSSYDLTGLSRTHIKQCEGTNTHACCTASTTVDVTNASTFRLKGTTDTGGSNVYVNGNSTGTETYFRFIRLGDT